MWVFVQPILRVIHIEWYKNNSIFDLCSPNKFILQLQLFKFDLATPNTPLVTNSLLEAAIRKLSVFWNMAKAFSFKDVFVRNLMKDHQQFQGM